MKTYKDLIITEAINDGKTFAKKFMAQMDIGPMLDGHIEQFADDNGIDFDDDVVSEAYQYIVKALAKELKSMI
jgi:hypothetical protein